MVDWTLMLQRNAERPFQSLLLFDKANIPVSPPPEVMELEQRRKYVAEQWAFFWMMTAVTIKYIIRNDNVFVTRWLEVLHGLVEQIQRQLRGEPLEYMRGSLTQLQPTREKQIESIRSLCKTMQELTPQIEQFSRVTLAPPQKEIETLLVLASEEYARD